MAEAQDRLGDLARIRWEQPAACHTKEGNVALGSISNNYP
jgi:hypothetical protein